MSSILKYVCVKAHGIVDGVQVVYMVCENWYWAHDVDMKISPYAFSLSTVNVIVTCYLNCSLNGYHTWDNINFFIFAFLILLSSMPWHPINLSF